MPIEAAWARWAIQYTKYDAFHHNLVTGKQKLSEAKHPAGVGVRGTA
jgi:hypothetical protein